MNDNIIYIYVLFEEHDEKNIRYVGKTTDVQRRYNEHLYDTGNSYKAHWVQSLRAIGKKIEFRVVETLTNPAEDEWQFCEQFWINFYKLEGCQLTNLDGGGIGGTPRSDVTKERIAAAQRGRTFTDEHRAKLSESHRKAETVAKLVASNKRRVWTEEQRKRSSENHKGRVITPEQKQKQRDAVTAWWANRKGTDPTVVSRRKQILADL